MEDLFKKFVICCMQHSDEKDQEALKIMEEADFDVNYVGENYDNNRVLNMAACY